MHPLFLYRLVAPSRLASAAAWAHISGPSGRPRWPGANHQFNWLPGTPGQVVQGRCDLPWMRHPIRGRLGKRTDWCGTAVAVTLWRVGSATSDASSRRGVGRRSVDRVGAYSTKPVPSLAPSRRHKRGKVQAKPKAPERNPHEYYHTDCSTLGRAPRLEEQAGRRLPESGPLPAC